MLTCLSKARMKRGKSLRQAGDSRPGCWMVNTDCRYELSESMAALVSASLASLRLAVTERSTAGEKRRVGCDNFSCHGSVL